MNLDIDISDFDKMFEEEQNRIKQLVKVGFQRAGETYVANARERGSYKDHTSNLRNANGYVIEESGNVAEGNTGRSETDVMLREMGSQADMELKAGNGMEYASYVEAKGYNVTSSGQLAAEGLLNRMFK